MNSVRQAAQLERTARQASSPAERRLDLARLPWLAGLIRSRWLLLLVRSLTLAGFVFTILVGLVGSPVGSHNFAIIFIWIAWWTALKLVFIPLGGRSWCSVCPLPMPGEWLQAGGLLSRSRQPNGLGLRWPSRLRGYWLASGLFLLIGIFSALTLTDARLTAWILLGLLVLATALSLVFERRSFCTNLCPIGGFTGLYAKTAPIEVRVIDASVCKNHGDKTCYTHCPWGIYPLAMRDSSQCGLCMECLRVCPQDNLALNLRPFGADLGANRPASRLDETILALVMLGSALSFSAVFTGPWGGLKSAAYAIGSPAWLAYSAGFLALCLLVLPGLFTASVWLGQRVSRVRIPLKSLIAEQSQALLPLGLFTWIAFTINFAFPKLSLVFAVLSDPLGWGWNLFGTAGFALSPAILQAAPILQVGILLVGLFWSVNLAQRQADKRPSTGRAALPVVGFLLAYTMLMLWLLVG